MRHLFAQERVRSATCLLPNRQIFRVSFAPATSFREGGHAQQIPSVSNQDKHRFWHPKVVTFSALMWVNKFCTYEHAWSLRRKYSPEGILNGQDEDVPFSSPERYPSSVARHLLNPVRYGTGCLTLFLGMIAALHSATEDPNNNHVFTNSCAHSMPHLQEQKNGPKYPRCTWNLNIDSPPDTVPHIKLLQGFNIPFWMILSLISRGMRYFNI